MLSISPNWILVLFHFYTGPITVWNKLPSLDVGLQRREDSQGVWFRCCRCSYLQLYQYYSSNLLIIKSDLRRSLYLSAGVNFDFKLTLGSNLVFYFFLLQSDKLIVCTQLEICDCDCFILISNKDPKCCLSPFQWYWSHASQLHIDVFIYDSLVIKQTLEEEVVNLLQYQCLLI